MNKGKSPYDANCMSKLFFCYLNPLINLANSRSKEKSSLKEADLFKLPDDLKSKALIKRFLEVYEESSSLILAFRKIFGSLSYIVIILVLLQTCLEYTGPIFIKLLLEYLESGAENTSYGLGLIMGLVICLIAEAFIDSHQWQYVDIARNRIQAAIYGSLYVKALRISNSSKLETETGKILNMYSSDASRLANFIYGLRLCISFPLSLGICLFMLYIEIGWIIVIALSISTLGCLLMKVITWGSVKAMKERVKHSDTRTKYVNEYVDGIRIIKYYAWEYFALKNIQNSRTGEVRGITKERLFGMLMELLWLAVPITIIASIIATYLALGGELTVAKIYIVAMLAGMLSGPLNVMAMVVQFFINCRISASRIKVFLSSNDKLKNVNCSTQVGEIKISEGNFAWQSKDIIDKVEEFKRVTESTYDGSKPSKKDKKGEVDEEAVAPVPKNYRILKNINVDIKQREMVGIVGGIGSGKSTLAQAILGEVLKESGEVNVGGTIGYVPQTSWIRNDTIRGNIIMDNPSKFVESKYNSIIDKSALKVDIDILEAGDMTEIGAKGINLSGGQKQRVSLARAAYSASDIYIIDDSLSALDAEVSQNVFRNLILGEMGNATLLVMKDGEIIEQGTYEELNGMNGEFARLLNSKNEENEIDKDEEGNNEEYAGEEECLINMLNDANQLSLVKEISAESINLKLRKEISVESIKLKLGRECSATSKMSHKSNREEEAREELQKEEDRVKGKLICEEEIAIGSVKLSTFVGIFKYGGIVLPLIMVLFFSLQLGFYLLGEWWLGIWAVDEYNQDNIWYLKYYLYFALGMLICTIIGGAASAFFIRTLSTNTQMHLMRILLQSPLGWFDTTPRGRIINRAVKDQAKIDEEIPGTLTGAVRVTLHLVGRLLIVCLVTPYFAIALLVLTIFYIYYYRNSIQFSRDSARLESKSRSPIFSLFEESLEGITTVRSYKLEEEFLHRMENHIDGTHRAHMVLVTGLHWLNLRLRLMGAVIVGLACTLIFLGRESIPPNLAGLSILNAFSVTGGLGHLLMILGFLEAQMAGLERIIEYIEGNPQEKPFKYAGPKVAKSWPEKGELVVNNLSLKYQPSLPTVLNGISFKCQPGERIGVVGRTGSGKSTLTLGLLRILEPHLGEVGEGDKSSPPNIIIDGVDACDIGLHELRERIAIIPQDPLLFSGTVATNLDPFDKTTFDEKLNALKLTGLIHQLSKKISEENLNQKEKEETKVKKESEVVLNIEPDESADQQVGTVEPEEIMKYTVKESGSNFSLGERQLICLARAIIRKPKLLLMDEATASIDEVTDHKIQEMLKTQFTNVTTLTIAHRIQTIIEYDKILVLEAGNIVDFDTPHNLLDKENGVFYNLIKENGEEFISDMKELAEKKNI